MRKRAATLEKPKPAQPTTTIATATEAIGSKPSSNGEPTAEERIRLQAYLKWGRAGRPLGDGINFSVEAEQDLKQPE